MDSEVGDAVAVEAGWRTGMEDSAGMRITIEGYPRELQQITTTVNKHA